MQERLKTTICGREFKNPIFLGSGSIDDSVERIQPFLDSNVGAIIPRTTRLHITPGRERHPSPHLDIHMNTQSMRNAEWTGNTIDYWRPYLDKLAETQRIVMSVSGRHIDNCVKVCQELDNYSFPLLEINISCPQSNEASGFIMKSAEHIKTVISSIKEAGVSTPISLKLGHSDYIVHLAQVAANAGADAITAINTLGPVFDFDISKGIPRPTLGIAGGKGGLSGRPIFPVALTDVAEICRHVDIPVIGCGGVTNATEAIKMIMAGASAVQIYTAAHLEGKGAPAFMNKMVDSVEQWLSLNQYNDISSIQGLALPILDTPNQMQPQIPTIDIESCSGCGSCETVCLEKGAISFTKNYPTVEPSLCIGCGACVSTCKTGAIAIK